jgi:hypothetical protein
MRQSPSLPGTLGIAVAGIVLAVSVSAQEKPAEAAPAAAPAAEATGPQPQALVVQPIVDLGEVTYGDSRQLEFVIRNTGDDVLRIHAAKSQCACAVMDFTREVAPGAEGKVSVRFDAALSGGPSAIPIEVVSNDPSSPTLRLTIKADIRYFIDAQPGYVRYIVVQDFEADSTVKQRLRSMDGSPMRVTGVESPFDFIEASFREATPEEVPVEAAGKQVWLVETRISPKAPIGPITGFLTVHVDHPKQKIVKLAMSGFVRPMFAVNPPEADFGDITLNEKGGRANLLVKNFATEKVAILGAESTVAGITAEVSAVSEAEVGRQYWVVLTYAPDMAKGKFSGVLRIQTESPKKPVIEVPLRGTIL